VRFLIDEMFGARLASHLTDAGHDALHVGEAGLLSASDDDVLSHAVTDDRVLVTENADDFAVLLSERSAAGLALGPVVIARKGSLPRQGGEAMHHALAEALIKWAKQNPEPYPHMHWLPRHR
jgi:predicted nuclease of predicted toxin-antitoxin system